MLSTVALSISLILTLYLCIVMVVMPVITIGKFIAALAAILIGSLSWICHHEKLYTASAATIVGITIVGGFVASLSNGGADGFVAPIMISAPVTAAVFIGARATLISAVAVVMAIVSLLFLERMGLVSEAPYSPATLDIAAIVMLSAATGICAAGVGYFAHAMQTQIRSLRSSQDRLMQVTGQLDHSAHHDSLTSVANRQGLQRHVETLLSGLDPTERKICLIHVDLDKFKSINDTYGHPVGDAVLINAAQIMTAEFNENALVARVGGDEFVIASSERAGTPDEELQVRCNRLIALLKAPMIANGVECRIGSSIGFATSQGRKCSMDSLMTDADLALYEAKREGRGQARAFTPDLRVKLEQNRSFMLAIEEALEDDRVCCVLQPQVCLRTGRVTGLEGLGRIRSETGALLPPAQILPMLTEMGRLAEFDFKVMQKTLDALVELRATGAHVPCVSINASSVSLRSPDYVTRVQAELEARGLTTKDVIVEILESTLIESADDAALTSIARLREAGIRALMDDFGSGHATISNLMKLELDGLKIDRSLIADIESQKTLEVVKAVCGLARNLKLTVIVEGVETAQQFAILRSIGCEAVQGFGICHPLELPAVKAWISSYGASNVHQLQAQLS
ncbi:MAG: EAL domain-containing protein [Hyphomonadaceae bacterium]|nr:EAL domain-containing protein [Hyphomonadaceae bacterium]